MAASAVAHNNNGCRLGRPQEVSTLPGNSRIADHQTALEYGLQGAITKGTASQRVLPVSVAAGQEHPPPKAQEGQARAQCML